MKIRRRAAARLLMGALLSAAAGGCGPIAPPTVDRGRDFARHPVPTEPVPTATPAVTPLVIVLPPDGDEADLPDLGPAPPLAGMTWLNGDPFTLESIRGQAAALVAFWSFTCVPCQQDVPTLIDLYERFAPADFYLVSVHNPEFEFQKDLARVQDHIARLRVPYPVGIDNDFRIWNAWNGRVRPAFFGVDWNGNLRFVRAGPGQAGALADSIDRLLAAE